MDLESNLAVDVEGVHHAYGTRVVLEAVSFRIEAGSFSAVIGPNGGGKSTLFHLLSTLIQPDSGRIRIFGNDVSRQRVEARRMLGVVFQFPALDTRLSVMENLLASARLYGLGRDGQNRASEALERLDLGDRARERVSTLSGGMRRRVELAKALISKPRLLLLDEPSVGLDPTVRAELWKWIEELRRATGLTVLFTTHLLDEVESCDEVIILARGKVLAKGSPRDLRTSSGGEQVAYLRGSNLTAIESSVSRNPNLSVARLSGEIRISASDAWQVAFESMRELNSIDSVELGRASLGEVFVQLTGERFEGSA